MWRQAVGILVATALLAGAGTGALAQPSMTAEQAATVAIAPRLHFSAAEMALAEAAARHPELAAFYGRNGLTPIFAGAEGVKLAQAMRRVLADSPRHGIPRSRYDLAVLDDETATATGEMRKSLLLARFLSDMTGGVIRPASADPGIRREVHRPDISKLIADFAVAADPEAFLRAQEPHGAAYLALQRALAGDEALAVPGDLPPVPEALWRPGARGQGVLALRERLASIGFDAVAAEPMLFDADLADAVARYQRAAGLPADGVAGPNTVRRLNGDAALDDRASRAIAVALERLRWMGGEDLEARQVWVNIPEFTARILENGQEVFRTRVVVGKDEDQYKTPEFSDQMEYVVVNPRWNVPRSITVKEYLPRLQANRNAVSHLDIIDGNGNVIPRDRIDFGRYSAANFPYRMRQKPSDDNALGLVKFIFPNPWNIYLHDTPTKHLFANSSRAYSHGCIRIGDPFDLAYALLSRQTENPQRMFHRALDSGRESWLKLSPAVPVHLVYFTAYPDAAGGVRFFPDIYGRDAAVWDALQKASLDSGRQNG